MLTRIDELKLVARCSLLDDRRAFGQLVEAHQTGIRRFLLNLCGDPPLSEDLAQETFLKAYMAIRTFRGLSGFKTWLYRIAYNEFYSWSRKRHEKLCPEDDHSTTPADSLPDDTPDSADTRMDVQKAICRLNEAERTAVVLFYMEDRPVKEIAAIMSMPEGTVKSHLSRAKAHLAQLLK